MKRVAVLIISGGVFIAATAWLFSHASVQWKALDLWEVVTGHYIIEHDTLSGTDRYVGVSRDRMDRVALINTETKEKMREIAVQHKAKEEAEKERAEATEAMRVDSAWTLLRGDPGDSCSGPTYTGEVAVHGWYMLEYPYGNKTWAFKLAPEDRKKIFVAEYDYSFRIADASAALKQRLHQASEKHPAELTIRGMMYYCEGMPIVSIDAPGPKGIIFK